MFKINMLNGRAGRGGGGVLLWERVPLWSNTKRFGKTLDAPSRPHLLVDLEQLLHGHLLVLRDPQRPVDAAEAAAATVLIVEQVLVLYLHKRRAGGRHGILTLAQSYIHRPARTHTHTDTQANARRSPSPPPPPQKKACTLSSPEPSRQ